MRCPRPALAEASPHRLGFSRRTCQTPQLYLLLCPQNKLGTRRRLWSNLRWSNASKTTPTRKTIFLNQRSSLRLQTIPTEVTSPRKRVARPNLQEDLVEVVTEGVVPHLSRRHHRDRPLHLGMAALLRIPLGLRLPTSLSLILCISPTTAADTYARG